MRLALSLASLVGLTVILSACPSAGVPDAGVADGAALPDARGLDAGAARDAAADEDAAADDAAEDAAADDAAAGDGAGDAADDAAEDAAADDAAADDAAAADAELDAGLAPDAPAPGDAGLAPDASAPGDAGCTFPPLAVDGPFPPGPPPPSAHLLLTDTSSRAIFRVALDGTVLQQWRSPVARVDGVAHDRRSPDGFWVVGYPIVGQQGANLPFRRVSFAGAVTATLAYTHFSQDGFHGLDFARSDSGQDVLVFAMMNRNAIDVVSGARTSDGARWFEGGLLPTTARWRGIHVERYACDDANSLVYWIGRPDALVLRDWPTGAELRTLILPTTDARGFARTPYGDFYVIDRAQRRVLHLDAAGALLGAFATPGREPADLSYGE